MPLNRGEYSRRILRMSDLKRICTRHRPNRKRNIKWHNSSQQQTDDDPNDFDTKRHIKGNKLLSQKYSESIPEAVADKDRKHENDESSCNN